jgi:hypothetical protein
VVVAKAEHHRHIISGENSKRQGSARPTTAQEPNRAGVAPETATAPSVRRDKVQLVAMFILGQINMIKTIRTQIQWLDQHDNVPMQKT